MSTQMNKHDRYMTDCMRDRLTLLADSTFAESCRELDQVVSGEVRAYATMYAPEEEYDSERLCGSAGFVLMRMQLLSLALGVELPAIQYNIDKFYGAEDLFDYAGCTHADPVLHLARHSDDLPFDVESPDANKRMFVVAATPLNGQGMMFLQPFNQMERWTNPRWNVMADYQLVDLRIALGTQHAISVGRYEDPTRTCAFFTVEDVLNSSAYPEDERAFLCARLNPEAIIYWPVVEWAPLSSARHSSDERRTADHELIYMVNVYRSSGGSHISGRREPLNTLPHCLGTDIFVNLLEIQPNDMDAVPYLGNVGPQEFRSLAGNWIHAQQVHPRKCNELFQQAVYGKHISTRASVLEVRTTYGAKMLEGGSSILDYVAGPVDCDEKRRLIRSFVLPFTFDEEECFLVLSFAYLSINGIRCHYAYVDPDGVRGCAEIRCSGTFDYLAGKSGAFYVSDDGHAWLAVNDVALFMHRTSARAMFDIKLNGQRDVAPSTVHHRPADARYVVAFNAVRDPATPFINVYART